MPDLLEHGSIAKSEKHSDKGSGPPAFSEQIAGLLGGDERLARRELRRQIARLERELGEIFVDAFPRRRIEWSVPAVGGPRILGVGELEQVRDALAIRIADVQSLLTDHAYVETRNRDLLEEMIASPERFHWVRISNEDVGEPGCRHWHSRPRWGLLGMLMGWWRVKLSSGCPLAGPGRARRIEGRTAALTGVRGRLDCTTAHFSAHGP